MKFLFNVLLTVLLAAVVFTGIQSVVAQLQNINSQLYNPQQEYIVKITYEYFITENDSTRRRVADETYPIPVKFKTYENALKNGNMFAAIEMQKSLADTVYCTILPD